MNKLTEYFKELMKVEILLKENDVPFFDISEFNQIGSGYNRHVNKLKTLCNDAISETVSFEHFQIIKNRLSGIENDFQKIWDNYLAFNDNFDFLEFKRNVLSYFQIEYKNDSGFSDSWMVDNVEYLNNYNGSFYHDFHDYLLAKETSFMYLQSKVLPIIGSDIQQDENYSLYNKYSAVFKNKYHTGIPPEIIKKIIEKQYLPELERVHWVKPKAEIIRIMLYLCNKTKEELKPKMLNDCFIFVNSKEVSSDDITKVRLFTIGNKNPFK